MYIVKAIHCVGCLLLKLLVQDTNDDDFDSKDLNVKDAC